MTVFESKADHYMRLADIALGQAARRYKPSRYPIERIFERVMHRTMRAEERTCFIHTRKQKANVR